MARRVRDRAVELSARDDRESRADRRDRAQRHRESSRPLRRDRRVRGGEGAHLHAVAASRFSIATIRARWRCALPGRVVQTFGARHPRGGGRLGSRPEEGRTMAGARRRAPSRRKRAVAGRAAQRCSTRWPRCALASTVAKIDAKVLSALAAFPRSAASHGARGGDRAACCSSTIPRARLSPPRLRRSKALRGPRC